jgi:hypothetical protein
MTRGVIRISRVFIPFFEMLAIHLKPRRANGHPLLGGVRGGFPYRYL